MIHKYQVLCLIALAFFFSACRSENKNLYSDTGPSFSSEDYQRSIQNMFIKVDSSFVNDSSHIDYFDTLKSFYAKRNYEPLFIIDFENAYSITPVLYLFSKAGEHGVEPAVYHLDSIKNELKKAFQNNPERYSHLANAELLFTDGVLKYSCHLRYGIVDPLKIFSTSYTLPAVESSKRDIFKPLTVENVFEYLKGLQPKNPQYKKLQEALKHFNNLDTNNWKPIKSTFRLDLIAERLALLGFFDTTTINTPINKNDSVFIRAVVNYQIANGMNGDGKLDQPTIDKLNIRPKEYIEKIKLSMERMRWTNYSDSSRYILVNIPDFRLHVIENGQ